MTVDPIEFYSSLDLDALRPGLIAGVPVEAKFSHLELSGICDTVEGITPHAKQWLRSHIEASRDNALSMIRQKASSIKLDGGASGFCPPLDADTKARESSNRLKEEVGTFDSRNRETLEKVRQNDIRYRMMYNEFARDAKAPSRWLEFGLLLPLVVLPESMLNFGAFRKAPFVGSDAAALGLTLIVAFCLAESAHFIGLFLRQFNYSWRGDDDKRKRDALIQLMIGLGLLLISLGAAGSARYLYMVPKIAEAAALGAAPPNIVFSIASLLTGNLLCFLFGAACAFALHDKNPDYEDTARSLVKEQKKSLKLRRKELDPKLRDITRRQRSDKGDIETKTRVMRQQPDYAEVLTALDQILAKDREVEGLLHEYANGLAGALETKNPNFQFSLKDYSGGTLSTSVLTIAQFRNLPIQLLRK